jgi:hypothetical protein
MKNNRNFGLPLDEFDSSSIHAVPVAVQDWSNRQSVDDDDSWEFFEALAVDGPAAVVVLDRFGNAVMALDGNQQMVDVQYGADAYLELHEGEDGAPVAGSLTSENLDWLRDSFQVDVETGPLMNYWYPISGIDDDNAAEAAMTIRDVNLCVVQVDGAYGLALTGGGQDYSWDIAAAYVMLGILPPVHFADLPNMAGQIRPDNPKLRHTYEAMQYSLTIASEQAQRASARLAETYPFW